MKKILNNSRRSRGIPGSPALILAPGEEKKVNETFFESMLKNHTVSQWISQGLIVVDGENVEPPAKRELKPRKQSGVGLNRRAARTATQRDIPPPELPDGVEEKGVFLHHHGGGYYDVYVNGIKVTTEKVRGKDVANEIAAEYENPDSED